MNAFAWGQKVSTEFRIRVARMADRLGLDPSWLMAVMAFETGRTFSPSVKNPGSSATGLIQFMAATAIDLGTTVEALAKMSALEQLDYVERYFTRYKGRLHTLSDVYMAVLWPAGIGKAENAVIFHPGSKQYLANRGLDIDHDGAVTKAEAAQFVAKALAEGLKPENATVPDRVRERDKQAPPTGGPTKEGPGMFAALLPIIGPILAGLIPQVKNILAPPPESVASRNMALAETVVNAIVKATTEASGVAQNAQSATEELQKNPELVKAVTAKVVTDPEIMPILEVGGGVQAARENDQATMAQDKPFWKASAVFWVSILLMPMVYWLVGSLIVGGVTSQLAADGVELPNWARLLLALFGNAWEGETRSGGFNLVIGLVLGGICGVYFGVSVTQAAKRNAQP